MDLPLQGTRDSAWAYLYESKGGYLINQPTRATSVSPISSTSPLLPRQSLLTQSLQRIPTYEDTIIRSSSQHKKSSSLDFMTRLSGDSSESVREREREREKANRQRKKKSWVYGGMGRFSAGRGVREMI